ncbi:MAG: hypothetical protein AAGA56_06680, partial [Myxococcota bacterium]
GDHNTVGRTVYPGGNASKDRGGLYGVRDAVVDAAMAPGLFLRTKYDLAAWRGRRFLEMHEPLVEQLPAPVRGAVVPLREGLGIDHIVAKLSELSSHPTFGELLPSADRGQAYALGVADLWLDAQVEPGETAESLVLAGYDERKQDGRPREARGYLVGQVLVALAGGRAVGGKAIGGKAPGPARVPVRKDAGVVIHRPKSVPVRAENGSVIDGYELSADTRLYRVEPKYTESPMTPRDPLPHHHARGPGPYEFTHNYLFVVEERVRPELLSKRLEQGYFAQGSIERMTTVGELLSRYPNGTFVADSGFNTSVLGGDRTGALIFVVPK